ncbi:unnamed protein product [Caenorhabditis bovis]|uniref:Protein kinase domain-containing protein n=1 Tax=Caenorhabditis bovis TaxID=2654633 RepID=A0A8S1ERU6_9PELO|nr:unnamed protein product [Caenorhabditis bovis]
MTTSGSSSTSLADRVLFPEIRREDIDLGDQLGTGTFGAVFKGTWSRPNGQIVIVALKKVFVLEKEAEILSKIRHKNIIQFYGVCKSTGSDYFIVTECAENGSLYDYIHNDSSENGYSFEFVIKWAKEIANGIQYLHYDAVDTIIHRDLKSKNVVLDAKLICKICDFGTSKDLTHSCTAPSWGGTAAWMSPEMILQNENLTTATDVWSYGVVLWEILSREVPYKDYKEFRIFSMITQNGITLAIPESCPQPLKQIMTDCWKMNSKERTGMRRILADLERIEKNAASMSECGQFMDHNDWKSEIEKQYKRMEQMKRELEKRREMLELRERALTRRFNLEHAIIASSRRQPEDVQQWSEHHTSYWIETVLSRVESDAKFVERIKAAVFKHRITGARLLEMTKNDLEFIGIHKLGSRMGLMREIEKLRETQNVISNFPTLQQARKIEMKLKTEKETAAVFGPHDVTIAIIVGMYIRRVSGDRRKFKIYVDSDWADDVDEYFEGCRGNQSTTASFMKSVCFSIIDEHSMRPIVEPTCAVPTGMACTQDWIIVDDPDDVRIKCLVNICFADAVTEPRNSEIVVQLTALETCEILTEKVTTLKLRRTSTSSSSLSSPGSVNGFQHATSSPQLRGFWHRKAHGSRHGLTEFELSSLQENMLGHSEDQSPPGRGRTKRSTTVHGGNDKWKWKGKGEKPKFF